MPSGDPAASREPAPEGGAWRWADAFAGPAHAPFTLGDGPRDALLIHGFPGTPAEMRAIGEALAGAGWTAHAPLLPGFGPGVDRLGEAGAEAWVAAVRDAWRPLGAHGRPRMLVGFSMGGAIALAVARELGCDALILVAPLSRLLPASWSLAWLVLRPIVRELPVGRWTPADWDDPRYRATVRGVAPEADLDDPAVRAAIEAFTLPTRAMDGVIRLGRASLGHARAVSAPALVVQGAADELVRPARTRALVAAYGGPLTYVEVPGAPHELVKPGQPGHAALLEAVAAFARQAG